MFVTNAVKIKDGELSDTSQFTECQCSLLVALCLLLIFEQNETQQKQYQTHASLVTPLIYELLLLCVFIDMIFTLLEDSYPSLVVQTDLYTFGG